MTKPEILKARIKTVFGAFKTPKEQKGQNNFEFQHYFEIS